MENCESPAASRSRPSGCSPSARSCWPPPQRGCVPGRVPRGYRPLRPRRVGCPPLPARQGGRAFVRGVVCRCRRPCRRGHPPRHPREIAEERGGASIIGCLAELLYGLPPDYGMPWEVLPETFPSHSTQHPRYTRGSRRFGAPPTGAKKAGRPGPGISRALEVQDREPGTAQYVAAGGKLSVVREAFERISVPLWV